MHGEIHEKLQIELGEEVLTFWVLSVDYFLLLLMADNDVNCLQETMHEDEWYNRSLSALRMNNSHPSLANSMLQYQT